MRTQSYISAVALAAALLITPQAAQAQLSLGVDLGGGGNSDGGGGLGLGVDVGVGDTNLGVDAGVNVGGDSLVDVDAGVGLGNSSTDNSGNLVDVGVGVGNGDSLVDADANLLDSDLLEADVTVGGTGGGGGAGTGGGGNGGGSAPLPSAPLVGVQVSALNDAARLDAVVDLIADPGIGDIDLDDAIDDTRVSIVSAVDLLGEDNLADVQAAISAGGEGREQLLAAIGASVELGSILEREGFGLEDVVSLHVNENGAAEIVVLDEVTLVADVDDLIDLGADDGTLVSTDLADLDIDLLTDEELAEIDLTLLPNEDQRLAAIIRLLGQGSGAGTPGTGTPGTGGIEIIGVDALLGEDALAELDLALDNEDGTDLVLDADILDLLEEQGLSPEAVIAVQIGEDGNLNVIVDADLSGTDLAEVDLGIGTDVIGGGDDGAGGGDGGTGGGDDGDPGDGGTGGGDTGSGGDDGGTGGGDNGSGGGDNGSGGNGSGGGDGNGVDPGNNGGGTGNGGTGSGGSGTGGAGTGGTGSGAVGNAGTGLPATNVPAGTAGIDLVVADVSCEAGIAALATAPAVTPSTLNSVQSVELVRIEGCEQTLTQTELVQLREAIEEDQPLLDQIEDAGVSLDALVGGSVEEGQLTLYFEGRTAA